MKIHTSRKSKIFITQHTHTHTTENHQKLEIMKKRSLDRLSYKSTTMSNLKKINSGLTGDASMTALFAYANGDAAMDAGFM